MAGTGFEPTSREPTAEGSSREAAEHAPAPPVPVDHRLAFVPETKPVAEPSASESVAAFPAERTFVRPESDAEGPGAAAARTESATSREPTA